jgi:hypothetical protein
MIIGCVDSAGAAGFFVALPAELERCLGKRGAGRSRIRRWIFQAR